MVAVPYLYDRVDEEIRQRVEAKIAAQYPHLIVRVRSAQLIEGEGIEVRGLSIIERDAAGPQPELLYLDELFLSCQTSLQELLKGDPKINQIRLGRPTLRMTRRPDGSWSANKLLPLPRFGTSTPPGRLEHATIEVFDPLKSPSSTWTIRDVHLTWKPTSSSRSAAAPNAVGSMVQQQLVEVEGYLAADYLERVELSGWVDPANQRWGLNGTTEGLEISPDLRMTLPGELADRLEVLGTLRAVGKFAFQVTYHPSLPQPLQFDVQGNLMRGRIDDPRLPYPLNDLRASVRFTNAGFSIEEMTARNGRTTVKVACRREGYDAKSPMSIEAIANRLPLDQFVDALPESMRIHWNKYLPEGDIDASAKLTFDGKTWNPELWVKCLNVSFWYYKFPYRLERSVGELTLRNNRLTIDLIAFSGGQPVRIDGEILNPGSEFTGMIEMRGDNIAFDEKLFAALPEKGREVIRSLNPHGTFNFRSKHWRHSPNQIGMKQQVQLELNSCAVNYEKFPYPIGNIRGTQELNDGHWTFDRLEGTNDTGRVTCSGNLQPSAEGNRLELHFTGSNVGLEPELRDALPPSMQRLWNSLRPRGTVELTSTVTYLPQSKRTSIKLQARPHLDTTIEPVFFPYRMEKLRGTFDYQDGHAELHDVHAEHGSTKLATGGSCDVQPDGSWLLQLKNLTVDRLRVDHDLVGALPEGLRKAAMELKPTGPINLRGTAEFAKANRSDAELHSRWDVVVTVNQFGLDFGPRLENIFGAMRLIGSCAGNQFQSVGELGLDSVTYKNFQFTEVRGPLSFDNRRVSFGVWAEGSEQRRAPRKITAKCFQGTAVGDCQVILGPLPKYALQAALSDADLARFAKENLSGSEKLNGKVIASIGFQGDARGAHTLKGAGSLRLHDADIYELPLMVALLKIISVKPPDTTAFTKSAIDFKIQGEHLVFDRIDFNGDAVSLIGQGQMNLDSQINLTFHAMVGRDDFRVPILSNVLGEASQQIMQIKVEGTLNHPLTRSEVLPGVSQAWQQLQADLQRGFEPSPYSQARELPPGQVPRR